MRWTSPLASTQDHKTRFYQRYDFTKNTWRFPSSGVSPWRRMKLPIANCFAWMETRSARTQRWDNKSVFPSFPSHSSLCRSPGSQCGPGETRASFCLGRLGLYRTLWQNNACKVCVQSFWGETNRLMAHGTPTVCMACFKNGQTEMPRAESPG